MTLSINGPGAARFLEGVGGPQGLMQQMAAGFMGALSQLFGQAGGAGAANPSGAPAGGRAAGPQGFGGDSGGGFAGQAGWSPFGKSGWTGGNMSPTNAQGQPSGQPSDVSNFFKTLFGSFLQYAFAPQNGGQQNGGQGPGQRGFGGGAPAGPALMGPQAGAGPLGANGLTGKNGTNGLSGPMSGRNVGFSMSLQASFTNGQATNTSSTAQPSGKTTDTAEKTDTAASTVKPTVKPATATVSDDGKKATVDIGNHKLTFDKSSSRITIDGGASIYGDPHLQNKDGSQSADFKKDTRIILDDGTKIYASVADKDGKPYSKDTKGPTYVDKIAIESPDGQIAFIDNLSEKNSKKLKAETTEAKPGNYLDIATRMKPFDPASTLKLDDKEENWLTEAGEKMNQDKMTKAEA